MDPNPDAQKKQANIEKTISVMSSPSRLKILKTSYERGPMRFSVIGRESGFDMDSKNSERGKFAYHLRTLKRSSLMGYDRGPKSYEITEKGATVYLLFTASTDIDSQGPQKILKSMMNDSIKLRRTYRLLGNIQKELRKANEIFQTKESEISVDISQFLKKADELPSKLPGYFMLAEVAEFGRYYSIDELAGAIKRSYDIEFEPQTLRNYMKTYEKRGYATSNMNERWKFTEKPSFKLAKELFAPKSSQKSQDEPAVI